jgi:hypothetical protein
MRELSNQAAAAKMIRAELGKAFPTTKFRVTSDSFSMGDSVDIRWEDGPTSDKVDAIVKKYQYGHFDGMQDLYEYSNHRKDIPQSKYVMTQRDISEPVKAKLIAEHNATFCERGQIKDINAYNEDAQDWNNSVIWREFQKRDF